MPMLVIVAALAQAAAPQTPPRMMEFRGADGKPLPEEIQARLRERFKDAAPVPRPAGTEGEVVVRGQRPRGSALGDIPPERTLSAVDIRSYGANSVAELIQALGAQVSSGRGREDAGPIVLLNGKRVSSFAEIAKIPTEAIERTDILPEEVALQYGYPADQKVVNVVTFERFSSRIGQLSLVAPTEGGQMTSGGSANVLKLRGDTRTQIDAEISRSSALLESERDVRQPSGDPTLGEFRTLLPASQRVSLGGTIAGTPLKDVSASLNGRFDTTRTRAVVGRNAAGPLQREGETDTAHLGIVMGGRMATWLWTATGNLDRVTGTTTTDTGIAATPRNDTRFANTVANTDVLLNGSPFALPAGKAAASLRAAVSSRHFDSRSVLGSGSRTADLGRDTASVQGTIDLPITGRATPALGWLGKLSANATAQVERVSDVGTLHGFGYGLAWSPLPAVSLLASVTDEQAAPTLEQLGNPLTVVPNVRTYDLVRGETVDVTRVFGGNRALRSDDRHVLSLGLTIKPFAKKDLILTADYITTRIDDPVAQFPLASPQVEAAFPDRITRDAGGRLARIDATPVNFAKSRQRQLRWGISYMMPLGPLPPGVQNANLRVFSSEAEAKRRLPPGAQMMRVDAGSPAARRFENLTSRLMFSLQHNWRLEDSVLLRAGGPTLNLLGGDALDNRGGRPRHEIEMQAGAFKRGLGARLTATWQSGTTVRGLAGSASNLSFGDLATVNLNLFANVADYIGRSKAPAWLKGTRISLSATNLFDARQDVRDGSGATPIGYQPAYLNPIGRTVALSLRKVF